jgi:hypothetical protein
MGPVGAILLGNGSRWGFVLGLATQPFWFYTSLRHRQWGIFIASILVCFRLDNRRLPQLLRVLQSFEGSRHGPQFLLTSGRLVSSPHGLGGERPDHLTSPPHPFSPRAPALHCSCPQRPMVVGTGSTDVIVGPRLGGQTLDNSRLSRLSARDSSRTPKIKIDQIRPIAYLFGGGEAQREDNVKLASARAARRKSTARVSAQRDQCGRGDGKLGWASFAPSMTPPSLTAELHRLFWALAPYRSATSAEAR